MWQYDRSKWRMGIYNLLVTTALREIKKCSREGEWDTARGTERKARFQCDMSHSFIWNFKYSRPIIVIKYIIPVRLDSDDDLVILLNLDYEIFRNSP